MILYDIILYCIILYYILHYIIYITYYIYIYLHLTYINCQLYPIVFGRPHDTETSTVCGLPNCVLWLRKSRDSWLKRKNRVKSRAHNKQMVKTQSSY